MRDTALHPVDAHPPAATLLVLGLQHLLVMYASAVAVPLIVGGAIGLSRQDLGLLVSADLFACGLSTLIQTLGLWIFGARLPIIMGVTFASVAPLVAIGTHPALGLQDVFGATIASGLIGILIAPAIGRLRRLFPPVVTGTVVAVIGLSLMKVAIDWAGGGRDNPAFGNPVFIGISMAVLCVVVLVGKYGKGFIANMSVMIGMAVGFAIAALGGHVDFGGVRNAPWVDFVLPFGFGAPHFHPWAIATMTMVTFVTFIESTGMFIAVGELVGRPVDHNTLVRGLRADGLGTVIGGIFNSFPHTSFSQNVGLLSLSPVKSRFVCAAAGGMLVVLGLFPKLAQLVASVPLFVLGGAGFVMFGMVAASGIRMLGTVDFAGNRHNLQIVAISLGAGMLPVVAPHFFRQLPAALSPVLDSGILLASISAIGLNAWLNGIGTPPAAAALAVPRGPGPRTNTPPGAPH